MATRLLFASKILTKQRFIKFNFQKIEIMDKKLYIQPSSREVIAQLKAVLMEPSPSFSTDDGITFPTEEGDATEEGGDAKLRGEWSENGLW